MHLVVINCSPRVTEKSNTNYIMRAFINGFCKDGNTAEMHHISNRKSWEEIRNAYFENENILMAVPLYVENIPGLMLEFLEALPLCQDSRKSISFLLQGGFDEACQLRCCEEYLQTLPMRLGCNHTGTLIKGGMFITHMMPQKARDKQVAPFYDIGVQFARNGRFTKEVSDKFAGAEYASAFTVAIFAILGPLQRAFFEKFFKQQGCTTKLSAKPYEQHLQQ